MNLLRAGSSFDLSDFADLSSGHHVDPEIPDGFFKSPYDCLGLIGARVDVSVPVVDRNPQPAEKTDQVLH